MPLSILPARRYCGQEAREASHPSAWSRLRLCTTADHRHRNTTSSTSTAIIPSPSFAGSVAAAMMRRAAMLAPPAKASPSMRSPLAACTCPGAPARRKVSSITHSPLGAMQKASTSYTDSSTMRPRQPHWALALRRQSTSSASDIARGSFSRSNARPATLPKIKVRMWFTPRLASLPDR